MNQPPSVLDPRKQVDIDYTDHIGRRFQRRIQPIEGQLFYNYADAKDSAPKWFVRAIDVSGDQTLKWFTMGSIHSWIALPASPPYSPPPVHPVDYTFVNDGRRRT